MYDTTSEQDETARSTCRAHSCRLRASWFASGNLLMWCVMLVVLIARVDVVHAVDQFS